MALPVVEGWLTDYVTAREIFDSHPPVVRRKFVRLCQSGDLFFCNCEKHSFRGLAKLKKHFCDDQNCLCPANGEIAQIAANLPDAIGKKKHHPQDNTSRILVASAIHNDYGIVSSKVGMFLTPVDVGLYAKRPSLTLIEFLAEI